MFRREPRWRLRRIRIRKFFHLRQELLWWKDVLIQGRRRLRRSSARLLNMVINRRNRSSPRGVCHCARTCQGLRSRTRLRKVTADAEHAKSETAGLFPLAVQGRPSVRIVPLLMGIRVASFPLPAVRREERTLFVCLRRRRSPRRSRRDRVLNRR